MMKHLLLILSLCCITALQSQAQTARPVLGTVVDSTRQTLPGTTIILTSDRGDSVSTAANAQGRFIFPAVKGSKISLLLRSIGYQTVRKRFTLTADGKAAELGNIMLQTDATQLQTVNVVGKATPIVVKEDTVQYNASAYKVRQGAPVEDLLKKLPGVDVDANGNVTAQGQSITKVRVNGKDVFGGDVQTITKNLPADIVENMQIVDDYGDQANLTGIRTGEPSKILNITIRKDKNKGYFGQLTAGDGADALPAPAENNNRYLVNGNLFTFKGDQQIAVLGSLNNTNANTFSFGTTNGGGGRGAGGNFGNGGGGGGGRGNAARGGGGGNFNSGLATTQDGINRAGSIGGNFRDQWGKNLTVYGSYSFADNSSYTNSTSQQLFKSATQAVYNQYSISNDNTINHRFTWNMEWRPDTLNYLKVTPTFSYSKSLTTSFDSVINTSVDTLTKVRGTDLQYFSNTYANSNTPNVGITALYNHRFAKRGRNFSITLNASTGSTDQSQQSRYTFLINSLQFPPNSIVDNSSRTHSIGGNLSYSEPIGKTTYLELNYAYNTAYTSTDKQTYSLDLNNNYPFLLNNLSNDFHYTFTTNRIGLNLRGTANKYNYILGIGVLPATIDGYSTNAAAAGLNGNIRNTTVNFAPTARLVYNFARSNTLSLNYDGTSNQPTFSQLQPVADFSNANFPVQGNPNLKPSYTNNLSVRYNKFNIQTGNVLFTNIAFSQTNDQIVSNIINFPNQFTANVRAANPDLVRYQRTRLTEYLNSDGYYTARGFIAYSKPWMERRYTLSVSGNASYINNVAYITNVDANNLRNTQKNTAKTFTLSPGLNFRTDITDVIDTRLFVTYNITSVNNSLQQFDSNIDHTHAVSFGVNGKNYFFKDWTISYDFTRNVNYGYPAEINVPNPNILNAYVERRFLKNNVATLRASIFDVFNQNKGVSYVPGSTSNTYQVVNRLSRYFLLTLTIRLQKFAGRSPMQQDRGNFRRGEGGGDRGGFGGPGGGGPPGGGGGPGGGLNE
ncbi:outer membrane beta-barrel protein [Mucilaginibacter sp.]